ncbi:hypothetical protein CLV35_2629 [Motilibacter peucedani]|uniref:Uncharacterized protein n=1 Tax=Motilibacter peucedani TaxID=598650 RepID=A0A420XPK2_9ACTN|nr:hypothetical protein [Motilibacter peucedani]RKS74128.1 hypothetical protein CLV35_2629 [Motilibacter peucedani]
MAPELFLAVRALVNSVDPVGLIALECPEDEYDPEVADLLRLRPPVTPDDVHAIFLRWFGEASAPGASVCAGLAAGLNELLTDRIR